MSVTIQGNTSTVISNNSAPEGTSEIAKITRQIQALTEKLGKICKRLARTVLIFTERSDQLSRATDRVPGLPANPGYAQ